MIHYRSVALGEPEIYSFFKSVGSPQVDWIGFCLLVTNRGSGPLGQLLESLVYAPENSFIVSGTRRVCSAVSGG